jgi:uncharacterized protein (TIGR00369 family)
VRQGAFWDVLEGRREPPPVAVLLGWELVEVDPEAGTIEASFTASEEFLNPAGDVQGGFLAAMLDDTMGPALVATLREGEWAPTIDLQVQSPGELRGRGRVVRRGRDIAFLAGELRNARGDVVATASASAIIRRALKRGPAVSITIAASVLTASTSRRSTSPGRGARSTRP